MSTARAEQVMDYHREGETFEELAIKLDQGIIPVVVESEKTPDVSLIIQLALERANLLDIMNRFWEKFGDQLLSEAGEKKRSQKLAEQKKDQEYREKVFKNLTDVLPKNLAGAEKNGPAAEPVTRKEESTAPVEIKGASKDGSVEFSHRELVAGKSVGIHVFARGRIEFNVKIIGTNSNGKKNQTASQMSGRMEKSSGSRINPAYHKIIFLEIPEDWTNLKVVAEQINSNKTPTQKRAVKKPTKPPTKETIAVENDSSTNPIKKSEVSSQFFGKTEKGIQYSHGVIPDLSEKNGFIQVYLFGTEICQECVVTISGLNSEGKREVLVQQDLAVNEKVSMTKFNSRKSMSFELPAGYTDLELNVEDKPAPTVLKFGEPKLRMKSFSGDNHIFSIEYFVTDGFVEAGNPFTITALDEKNEFVDITSGATARVEKEDNHFIVFNTRGFNKFVVKIGNCQPHEFQLPQEMAFTPVAPKVK